MKNIILFSILIYSICLFKMNAQTGYLYRIDDTQGGRYELGVNRCGYINEKGDTTVPVLYLYCYADTVKTIGIIRTMTDGFIAIDKSGKKLFNVFVYDNGPDYVVEGLFRIIDDNEKIGFADMDGNIVIPPQFEVAMPFKNGFAAVCVGGYKETVGTDRRSHYIGGKWGFIDKTGKMVISPQFDFVNSFYNGTAAFCMGGKSILKGEYFVWEGGKWGLVDTAGNVIVKPIFDRIFNYDYGNTMVIYEGVKQKLSEVPVDY